MDCIATIKFLVEINAKINAITKYKRYRYNGNLISNISSKIETIRPKANNVGNQ